MRRRYLPWLLAGLIAALFCLEYYLIAKDLPTMFWGLAGDESFIASLFEHQAYGHFFADLNYLGLPLFYPPLYFLLGGIVGKLFHLANGIVIAKAMVLLVLAVAPLSFFALLKQQWRENYHWAYALLAAYLLLAVHNFDEIILKPYEFLSGGLAVIMFSYFFSRIIEKSLKRRELIYVAIFCALLFSTFYFWLIIIALAGILFLIFERERKSLATNGIILIATTAILSSWYWLPNLLACLKFGYENWQPLYFVPGDFALFFPYFSDLSLLSVISGFSIISFFIYSKKDANVRSLLYLFLAGYMYQLVNILWFARGGRPMQASKAFLFFTIPTLVLASIPLLKEAAEKYILPNKYRKQFIAAIIIVLYIYSPLGFFIQQPGIQKQLAADRAHIFKEQKLYESFKTIPDLSNKVFLTSGFPELEARLPYYNFISYNINLSHPAGQFTKRHDFILDLAKSKDAAEFYSKLKNNPFQKIDGLILYGDTENYYLYFWLDNYPNGGREEQVKIDKKIIDTALYNVNYTDKDYSILLMK